MFITSTTTTMSMPTTMSAPYSYTNITHPGQHDVMIGRGGGTNHNPGNIRFRQLICTRKDEYKVAKRSQKPIIAQEIVSAWRAQVPPGRFLKQDERMLWYDVGNEQAKVKAAQKLRDSNKDNSWTNNKVPGEETEESKVKKRDPPQSLAVEMPPPVYEMPQPFEMPPPVYEMPPPVYYAPVIKKQKTSSEDDTTPNTLFAADCLNTMKTDEGIQIYQV